MSKDPITLDTDYNEKGERIMHRITLDGRDEIFMNLLKLMHDTHEEKDADYSGDESLSNFKECEDFDIDAWKGVLIRISDKWSRVKSLTKSKKEARVEDEPITKTLLDISVYALICIILFPEPIVRPEDEDPETKRIRDAKTKREAHK